MNETEQKQEGLLRIFALDIGTHSVIGVVGYGEENLFHIEEICQMEYPRRAMQDGQIEDIEQVALVAGKVRDELESRLNTKLESVYIAAAGRALRTQRASFELKLEADAPIHSRQIAELEMGAIQRAEEALTEPGEDSSLHLYYIGHSVVRYSLDGYPMSTLLDHKGKEASVEIIATFLPGQVLDSLHMAMKKAGLRVENVTLEPIAAMNAIIPKELRMLNLVLVDIGAGTSDIAVSEGGSVSAYTMATVAGDEITETIVREFLVDFPTAEEMKKALSQKLDPIPYQDILGIPDTVGLEQLQQKILPAAQMLCDEICNHVFSVNEKAPSAVFLVGGGSKLLGIAGMIADRLSIDERKVAVGGNNYMKKMVVSQTDVSGPEFATPVGIALTALSAQNSGKYSVSLNGKEVDLIAKKPTNLMELLMMQGYERSHLLGRAGKCVTFELDGRKRVVRGGHPTAAVLTVNGRPAGITTPVQPNARIHLIPSQPGADAAITIREAVEDYKVFDVVINGARLQVGTIAYCNGKPAAPGQSIQDLDVVQVHEVRTLSALCGELQLVPEEWQFTVNGLARDMDYELCPGDEICYHSGNPAPKEAPNEEPLVPGLRVTLNNKVLLLPPKQDHTPYQFVDMLNFVEIDPRKPQGDIVLQLNGGAASYLNEIHDGDSVEIHWSKA